MTHQLSNATLCVCKCGVQQGEAAGARQARLTDLLELPSLLIAMLTKVQSVNPPQSCFKAQVAGALGRASPCRGGVRRLE